jgi:CBS domain-containing protein
VFLDIRCVYGQVTLIKQLQAHIAMLANDNHRFISALTANMLRNSPPVGFFRKFVLVKNGKNKHSLNIKNRAINPIVDLARIYGLQSACIDVSTFQRLQKACEQEILSQSSYDDLTGAYNFICSVRLRYHLKMLREGQQVGNHLPPSLLSQFERNHLKEAFWIISAAQEMVRQRFLAQGLSG